MSDLSGKDSLCGCKKGGQLDPPLGGKQPHDKRIKAAVKESGIDRNEVRRAFLRASEKAAAADASRMVAIAGSASNTARRAVSQRLPPPCRFIYVIGSDASFQKIGIATDPGVRLAALQTASHLKLKLHAFVAVPFGAAIAVERRTHQALRAARVKGEWFNIAPSEAITAVKAAAAMCSAMEGAIGNLPLFDFVQVTPAPQNHWLRLSIRPTTGLRTHLERFAVALTIRVRKTKNP